MAQIATKSSIPTVAGLLKAARTEKALSLDDVAKEICVRRCFLEAIESSDFENLPKRTFAVGFVNAYAKSLGLDAPSITAQFKAELTQARTGELASEEAAAPDCDASEGKSERAKPKQQIKVSQKKWPAWLSPIAGLMGAAASWMFISAQMTGGGWYAAQTSEATDLEVQQLAAIQARYIEKDDSNILAAPKNSSTGAVIGASEKDVSGSLFFSAANADVQIDILDSVDAVTLHANEDSWLQLSYADGSAMWSGVLRAGQDYTPRLAEDVFLTTSNAGAVFLINGQQKLGPLGDRGEIIADFALNRALVSGESLSEAVQAH